MKKIILLLALIIPAVSGWSQSKKDLESKMNHFQSKVDSIVAAYDRQIAELKSENGQLASELSSLKLNLTNASTSLSLLAKSNSDLEAQHKVLTAKVDSLTKLVKLRQAAANTEANDNNYITNPQNEEDSIQSVVYQYYAAPKWEDRLAFVLDAEKVKPHMRQQYSNNYNSRSYSKKNIIVMDEKISMGQSFKVHVNGSTVIYMKKTSSGYKIDWEASTGHNATSIKYFEMNKSTTATNFRGRVILQSDLSDLGYVDEYLHDIGITEDRYYSVSIMDVDYNSMYAAVNKTSTDGKRLLNLLKDGKEHKIILQVQYQKKQANGWANDGIGYIPVVSKFVSEDWSM